MQIRTSTERSANYATRTHTFDSHMLRAPTPSTITCIARERQDPSMAPIMGANPAHSGLTMWFVWVRSFPCESVRRRRGRPRDDGVSSARPQPPGPLSLQAEGTTTLTRSRVDSHDHETTCGRPSGTGQQSPPQSDPPGRGKERGGRFDPQQVRLGDKRRGARRLVDFSANRSSVTHTIVGGEQDVLAPTN